MSLQQVLHPRASANGNVRRKVDRDMGSSKENKVYSGKPNFNNFVNAVNGGKVGGVGSPSRDRLIYVMAYLIGHRVEVHVKNGSIISGIFHTTDNEKDFGIILKMAQVIKDGSVRGANSVTDTVRKPQTMIIPARELVQVLAKDVSLSSDEFTNEHTRERRKDLMTDSAISHSHHVELDRELEPWMPDKDDPEYPGLEENFFARTCNRNWDQFEINEALFGVKSTFNEELYTTKLERGPQMRELEKEASRIAREIEGEETCDQHLVEERGIMLEDFDLDEEDRFSAVRREGDDRKYEENERSFSDVCNTEIFGGSLTSIIPGSYSDFSRKGVADEAQPSSTYPSVDKDASSQIQADKDAFISGSTDLVSQLASDCSLKSLSIDDESRELTCHSNIRLNGKQVKDLLDEKVFLNDEKVLKESQTSTCEDREPEMNMKGLSPSATAYDPSCSGQLYKQASGKLAANESAKISVQPGSSTSSTSEHIGPTFASNGRGLSPSSSVGSLSSEKSSLNPYAKEFKLNPSAKSFIPSAPLRPQAPVSEGSFYYASSISAVPHVHNLPVGIGFGPSFGGHQPIYPPQAAQMQPPQAYIPPNSPMYGQQMFFGQPRPVFYMPAYQPEAPYKGRGM